MPEKAVSREGFAYVSLANDPQITAIMRQVQMAIDTEDVEWQMIPTLHITLAYAPEVERETLIQIGKTLILDDVLPVESDSLGVFENGDERALHLVVKPNNRLRAIQQLAVESFEVYDVALSEYSDPAKWQPHITLAYLPPGVDIPELDVRLGTFAESVIVGAQEYEPIIEIRSPINQSIRSQAERAVDTGLRALSEVKADPGERLMLLFTSNAYRDREDEILKEAALSRWVEQAWDGDQYIEQHTDHLWWHGGDPIGTIEFSDMEGPFLIEVSREAEDAVINLADDGEDPYEVQVSQLWDALEGRTDMGASHRFAFRAGDEEDGVYEAIVKEETSTLPRDRAANQWTLSYVIRQGDDMSQARLPILDKLLGRNGNGEAVAEVAGEAAAELDAQGVERKDIKQEEEEVAVTPPPEEEEQKQSVEEVAMTLAQGLFDASSGDISALTVEDVAAILAGMLQPTSETPPEEMPMEEAARSLSGQMEKDMADYIAQSTQDMGALAQAIVQILDTQKSLTETVQAIQEDLGDRPRQASAAPESDVEALTGVLTGEDGANAAGKALATLKTELNKGLNGQKTVLGIAVTE